MAQTVSILLGDEDRKRLEAICLGALSPVQTYPAGEDHPLFSRAAPCAGGAPPRRRQPACGVALAAALRGRGRRRPPARQDPQAGARAAVAEGRRQSSGADLLTVRDTVKKFAMTQTPRNSLLVTSRAAVPDIKTVLEHEKWLTTGAGCLKPLGCSCG